MRNMASSGSSSKLLDCFSESLCEQEKLCDNIRRSLELSEDPWKLVVDSVGDFFSEKARKRSCVILLEQLASLRPRISPAVKVEALSLARRWRVEIGEKGQNGVLEVMGFLLLLRAYDLVDEFDSSEITNVLRNSGRPVGTEESGVPIGLNANDLASISVVSQQKRPDRSLKEELVLVNQIASSFTSHFDALTCLCVDMNGNNLKLFLHEYLGSYDWSTELRDALKQASDPAKLVLDTMAGFISPQLEYQKSLVKDRVRTSSVLLLEQLMAISPRVNPSVKEEALKMASHRGSNFAQMYKSPVIAYGFLLFVAIYRLKSKYKVHELFSLLVVASQYKAHPKLCKALCLAHKAEELVQILIRKEMFLGAVDYVYAHDLVDQFPPDLLLQDHLNLLKRRIDEQSEKISLQQAADEEIAGIKTIIEYIVIYKLESELPPEVLENRILELEKKKNLKVHHISNAPIPPVSYASTEIDAQVKVESFPKEDQKLDNEAQVNVERPFPKKDSKLENQAEVKIEPTANNYLKFNNQASEVESSFKDKLKLDNQVEKARNEDSLSSTSRWPRFESLFAGIYGKGLTFLSSKDKKEMNFSASPFTTPWPELKSICANMDGKSMKMFLRGHLDDQDLLLQNSVCDALKYALDPAKLVLDAIEFDRNLSEEKVRNTRILLLEQLNNVSPQISPSVKEEARKMANEWREMEAAPSNGYDFLLFIASYELVSSYELDEVLELLLSANYHKATPSLCRILGLQNEVSDLIKNLIQKNLMLEAIEHIYEFELMDKFKPVNLVKYHLYTMRAIFGANKLPSEDVVVREIAAARRFMACIKKYKLESQYSLKDLEKYIHELENSSGKFK